MNRTMTNRTPFVIFFVLHLWPVVCVAGPTFDPAEGPGRLLSRDGIAFAEGNVRRKGYDANDISKLRLAATDASLGVRIDALVVLTHRHGQQAIPILMRALDDPWSLVRCTAARMLGVLGNNSGLDRMRKDMVELASPEQKEDSSESQDRNGQPKRSFPQSKEQRLYDALEAADVLAEFGDSSGYELAAQAALQSRHGPGRLVAIAVVAKTHRIDAATLKAKGYDPEAVLLKIVESETAPIVLRTVADCAMSHMKPESKIRILEAIERSPRASELTSLQRQAIRNGLVHARQQVDQEKDTSRQKKD
jgi:hypothetical protein